MYKYFYYIIFLLQYFYYIILLLSYYIFKTIFNIVSQVARFQKR